MSIRVSPISRTAAILITGIGVFVLAAGLSTGETANDLAGVAFIVLGVFLYAFLIRFTGKLGRELDEAPKG